MADLRQDLTPLGAIDAGTPIREEGEGRGRALLLRASVQAALNPTATEAV